MYNIVRNKENLHIFTFLLENRQFAFLLLGYSYYIHNGYCVSNAVDYAKKNDVLPTICQLNKGVSNNIFLY